MLATPDEEQRRLAICQTCEHLEPELVRCLRCGCFMKVKAKFKSSDCPEGKWSTENA